MSKKRHKQRKPNPTHFDLKLLIFNLLNWLVSLLPTNFAPLSNLIMMVGKRELPDPEMHAKKRARLLNKQSKVLAMYRLVHADKHQEQNQPKVEEPKPGRLNEEEFRAMKKELAERKKALNQLPRFNLNSGIGAGASVFSTPYSTRTPILLSDIEHLITYGYGGNALVPPPSRWCGLQKPNRLNNVVVVCVSGVGLSEFVDNEEMFSGVMGIFGGSDDTNRCIVEFLSPEWYGGSLQSEIQEWGLIGGIKKPEETPTTPKTPNPQVTPDPASKKLNELTYANTISQLSSVFPIKGKLKQKHKSIPPKDSFSRTDLILTLPQLITQNYPLPIPSNTLSKKQAFVPTADSYDPVTPQSKMYSIDCEMCSTAQDPQVLTKIAVIDEEMKVVYESLVKPEHEITDYLTRWSGITKKMLEGVTTTLEEVQEKVRGIVGANPDCVFVGQSLNCDLKAMKMTHPYVIDTSCIFNLTGIEGRKNSLRDLAYNLLDHKIQVQDRRRRIVGHCPVEDASAAMKLVNAKLDQGFNFGNALRNSNYLLKSTKLAIDASFIGNSFKQSKLDKNVLLVHQSPPPQTQPPSTPSTIKPLVTHLQSTSNSQTLKTLSLNIYEYFLNIGFYTINPDSENYNKCLQKLDKRVTKLYENLNGNTLFILMCSKETGEANGEVGRKNNGIALVRCKVNEIKRERKE